MTQVVGRRPDYRLQNFPIMLCTQFKVKQIDLAGCDAWYSYTGIVEVVALRVVLVEATLEVWS